MHESTFCEATELPTGETWGVIEGTPAYVLGFESNIDLPGDDSILEVADTMRAAFEAIMEVEFKGSLLDMNVNRLDLPIDLQCEVDLPSFIVGLGSHLPKYARKRALYLGENGAQTLMTGSGARSGRVYDKEAETLGNPLARGSVRFEPQLRKGALRREGITTLSSILTDSLKRIRRDAFTHFGWDKVVCNAAGLGQALRLRVDMGLVTQRQAWILIGGLVYGFDQTPERSVRRYRAMLSDLGIAVDLDGFKLSDLDQEPVFVQANYEKGRVEAVCV